MKDLMFWGMFIACLLISAMTFYIMYSQAMVNRDLERKHNDLKNEFLHAFGWDNYERKVEELIKFKKEIERLEIIKKALDVQKLEELQKRKDLVEREIQKLEK